jgi:hypothetical protein
MLYTLSCHVHVLLVSGSRPTSFFKMLLAAQGAQQILVLLLSRPLKPVTLQLQQHTLGKFVVFCLISLSACCGHEPVKRSDVMCTP